MEEAVKQCPVIQEKLPEVFVNGKNTVPVGNVDQFERHGGSALHGVEVTAGRAETAVAAERDEFQLAAVRAAVHCPAKGGVATVDHLINVFHLSISGMKGIFNFFVMVPKNSL